MYNHAPDEYRCPFCLVASQQADPAVETCPDDMVYATDQATAFISSHWWPHNPGHVIVIPNQHYENIYDLPLSAASAIHALVREIAVAMKQQYRCPGVSTRQHNEPAGNQDVWHYHLHVFPRYHDDQLYHSQRRRTTLEERQPYALQLRTYFTQ
jgi:histidine triad (HIT) family protein